MIHPTKLISQNLNGTMVRAASLNPRLFVMQSGYADTMSEIEMSEHARYYVIPDGADEGILIFDSQTGAIQRPECWRDLVAYYYYLVGRGHIEEAQDLLAESMAGHKPITKMLMSVKSPDFSASYS